MVSWSTFSLVLVVVVAVLYNWEPRTTLFLSLLVAFIVFACATLGRIKVGIRRKLGTVLNSNTCSRRRLGLLERWYVAHSRAGHHTGFLLAVDLETNEAPSLQDMRARLRKVARQFPWLRARIKRDGITGVDSRDLLTKSTSPETDEPLWGDDLYVEVSNDKDRDYCSLRQVTLDDDSTNNNFGMAGGLAPLFEQEGQAEWHDEDPSGCLWRVVLVRYPNDKNKFALILSFHHTITDGMGAIAVLQAILEDGDENNTSVESPTMTDSLPPPMEDLMDTVPRLSHLLVPVLLDRIPQLTPLIRPPHFQGMPHDSNTTTNRTSRMVCLKLLNSKDEVSRLRDVCRTNNKTTVNSVCVAALAKAAALHIQKSPHLYANCPGISENGVSLKIITAANERDMCGCSNHDLGTYLVGPQVWLTAPPTSSLNQLASLYQNRLEAEDWIEFAKKHSNRDPNGREDSLEVSNLGNVNLLNKHYKVGGLWFAQGRNVTGPALTATLVTTNNTTLRAVLSAVPQAISYESLVEIGRLFQAELESFVVASEC